MNQDQNNLNLNNLNVQNNNGISNNQPIENNQNMNANIYQSQSVNMQQNLNVKSYKYVVGANMISKLSEMVGRYDLDVDYGFLLQNNDVTYSRNNSSYYNPTDDIENKVSESIYNGDVELFCLYNAGYNRLSIILNSSNKYIKYYVDDYDNTKEYSYYLNNFNEMLIS